jgi:hypothetical protein
MVKCSKKTLQNASKCELPTKEQALRQIRAEEFVKCLGNGSGSEEQAYKDDTSEQEPTKEEILEICKEVEEESKK